MSPAPLPGRSQIRRPDRAADFYRFLGLVWKLPEFNAEWRKKIRCLGVLTFFKQGLDGVAVYAYVRRETPFVEKRLKCPGEYTWIFCKKRLAA